MPQFTKIAIESTFLKLLKVHSLDKITVKDIVEECGINRNTFYYYFQDIYDLIDDVFAVETKKVLEDKKQYDTWYEEIRRVAFFVVENKAAIAHIYYSKSREVLENYLFAISCKLTDSYVEAEAKRLGVSDEDKAFVCAFYGHSLAGITLNWIKGNTKVDSEEFIRRVAAIFEGTVTLALECNANLSKTSKLS